MTFVALIVGGCVTGGNSVEGNGGNAKLEIPVNVYFNGGGGNQGTGAGAPMQPVVGCGCWGPAQPGSYKDGRCASGYSSPVACQGFCPMGGQPWGIMCQ